MGEGPAGRSRTGRRGYCRVYVPAVALPAARQWPGGHWQQPTAPLTGTRHRHRYVGFDETPAERTSSQQDPRGQWWCAPRAVRQTRAVWQCAGAPLPNRCAVSARCRAPVPRCQPPRLVDLDRPNVASGVRRTRCAQLIHAESLYRERATRLYVHCYPRILREVAR